MKIKTILTIITALFLSSTSTIVCQEKQNIIAAGAKVELLATDFSFTEGPAVDKKGNVYFTDQPNNKILKWSTNRELSVFLDNSGRANGLYFDKKGNLISCSDMDNELWSIDMKGKHKVLVTDFDQKKLNGPNDVWVHPKSGIYFTDPFYKRNYWTRDPKMQQEGEYVYYLSPDQKKVVKVDTELKQPNGIIGSPDGKLLYVADIKANKTYVYNIQSDGTLSDKKLFTSLGSDGMTIDNKGNVYLTGKGVTVFNSKGEQIEHIAVDANWTANVCFGGKDMKMLFITASQHFYALRMNVKGVR